MSDSRPKMAKTRSFFKRSEWTNWRSPYFNLKLTYIEDQTTLSTIPSSNVPHMHWWGRQMITTWCGRRLRLSDLIIFTREGSTTSTMVTWATYTTPPTRWPTLCLESYKAIKWTFFKNFDNILLGLSKISLYSFSKTKYKNKIWNKIEVSFYLNQ